MKPEWFPDWSGQPCAIIASGPSVKGQNIAALKGRMKVIAIKRNVELAPWADVVYGCDVAWWRAERGLPKYQGIKVCWRGNGLEDQTVKRIDIEKHADKLLTEKPGTVGSGGNSGFQALNLAVQFGVNRILLIGFDMDDRGGPHWYGRNQWPMCSNPSHLNFRRWIKAFTGVAPDLSKLGITVWSTSRNGALKCFPFRTIDEALTEWA